MVFIWIVMPLYVTIVGFLSSDVIEGTCIPWAAHVRHANSSIFVITYVLPLITMVFCYTRIVYKLKRKVTSTFGLVPFCGAFIAYDIGLYVIRLSIY